MFHQKFLRVCAVWWCFAAALSAHAQFTISGVTDKSTYNNTATLTVNTQAGYTYSATLNYTPVAVGAAVVLNTPDFYELRVDATNSGSSAVTSEYRRFIINASQRVGTEMGIPPHVPFPVIQSSPAEFVGARLRVLTPTSFPIGYEIPVVAWVVNDGDHAVRANGLLAAASQNSIQLKRGTGSGFLASNQPPGVLNYTPSIGGISSNKPVNLEAGTVWTSVAGTLNGVTTWPDQSRIRVSGNLAIPAGSSLTIGAGSIVLLNSGVNITNDGAVVINGSVEQPVVFMPNSRSQPWGGFYMRTSSGSINATGAIFIASGAAQSGAPGHRSEQCLFLVDNAPSIVLSDSAAIYLAGQLGHAYRGGTFTFTRFLMQRATTGGEYTGASFIVNDSAFIECPDDSANFVDGDNDALYFVSGSHYFTNTLIGWTKDDGIDSGGSGYGPLTYQSCWFEATFHEGNSLSGFKNVHAHGTVYFDCGQGIEGGYDSPTGRVENCFFSMNQSGIRQGDNYATFSEYTGPMTATNNISIYNHRDLFGFNWDNSNSGGWTNNYRYFFASNNLVSALDTNYPNNTLWNPATDGWRLGALGGVGRVGVGFGVRGSSLAQFPGGIPVGLSRFCTNEVQVDYVIDGTDGSHATGTLVYPAGLTRRFIPPPSNTVIYRFALRNGVNADVTGGNFYIAPTLAASNPPSTLLLASNANWKYFDKTNDLGTAWRAFAYSDLTWSNGAAQLGFGDGDETTMIASNQQYTTYFRRTFAVGNPLDFASVSVWLLRDDAGVVFINGNEVLRSPNLPALPSVITNRQLATATGENSIDTATVSPTSLLAGDNLVAVEIHQQSLTSSDISFALSLTGNPAPGRPRLAFAWLADEIILYSSDNTAVIEEASDITGPWSAASRANTPTGFVAASGNKFYRLRK